MRKLIAVAGLGAALTYLFDPVSGTRRRAEARDRLLAFLRRRNGISAASRPRPTHSFRRRRT